MEAGAPDQLVIPFRWTKANLAREAGVHIATILTRNEDGTHRWCTILDRFESLRTKSRAGRGASESVAATVASVGLQLALATGVALEKEQELARQAELICELRSQLRDYADRAAHTKEVMQANTELRAECARLQRLVR